MFLGEMVCLIYYAIKMYWLKRKDLRASIVNPEEDAVAEQVNLHKKINPFYLAIPALLDLCSSSLLMVALT